MVNLLRVLGLSLVLIFLIAILSFADEIKPASLPNPSFSGQGTPSSQNEPPDLVCPEDGSIHTGMTFISTSFSVTDPNGDPVTVTILDINPPAPYPPSVVSNRVRWWTVCALVGDYTIRLMATDPGGLKDTCGFTVTLHNQSAQITCPDDDTVYAGDTFVSSDFSIYDPDGDPVVVRLKSITPKATYYPTIVDNHVAWKTTSNEDGDYVIRLIASENCVPADTCEFTVTVMGELPGKLTCPEDDSVHAGRYFISTDFSVTGPGADPANVTLCGVDPPPINMPTIKASHVEWQTECDEAGKVFTICLHAPVSVDKIDTCHFEVTVYNQPPQISCPDDDSVFASDKFVSTDFSVTDPEGDPVVVAFLDIDPAATNDPTIVDNHVEWLTSLDDLANGPVFTITLTATDSCGAADTCDFLVKVVRSPIIIIVPDDDSVHAGDYFVSTDFVIIEDKSSAIVNICGVTPAPTHQPFIVDSHVEWQTECADDGKIFDICLEAVSDLGARDTGIFHVTVYNQPPELTCPEYGVVRRGETFFSSGFSATDPDGDPVMVSFLDIDPSAANDPHISDGHVEWITTAADELREYKICLIAEDHCKLADTCEFTVRVDEPTGVFECPEDDSVHAEDYFISTDFVLTHPGCDPYSVEVLEVNPPVTNMPFVSNYHVEWQTTCDEDGDYLITLITGPECPTPDTCSFTVTVYNRPPNLICPDYGTVIPEGLFISTDFYFIDPDGDEVMVTILDIDSVGCALDWEPWNDPYIKEQHVEWQTICVFGDYIITLTASDPCGLADTCEFMVTITLDPVPDFYIWVYPITAYVDQGNSADYLVELNKMNGYYKPCSLHVSWLPDPPNCASFLSPVMTPTAFTTMTVHTSALTGIGTYTMIVTGKEIGGFVAHSKKIYLTVGDLGKPTDVADESDSPAQPGTFTLFQNQPNPFNPETQLSYYLSKASQVKVDIYNVLGQKVRDLFEGHQNAGTHILIWNGRDNFGKQLSSGIYLYRLEADGFQQTKKMTLMK
jgi:hypothetical protein